MATVSLPGGIWGWTAYEDRDRTRAIERWGIPQDVEAEPSIESCIPLNLNINSLHLSLNTFSSRPTVFKLNPDIARISFFLFSRCTTLDYSNISFLFTNSIIYIEIWHIYFWLVPCDLRRHRHPPIPNVTVANSKSQPRGACQLDTIHIACVGRGAQRTNITWSAKE